MAKVIERSELRAGALAAIPLLVAFAPFALAVGSASATSSLPGFGAWATSWLIYGGTAQLVFIQLRDAGAAAVVVLVAVTAVNARLLLYSGGMAPHWRDASTRWRAVASYLLVDPVYVVAAAHQDRVGDDRAAGRRYYMGVALGVWIGWQALTAAGAVLGASLPGVLRADVLTPVVLVAMVGVVSRTRAARIAAVSAAAGTLLLSWLPLHLGFVVGGVLGVAAGVTAEARSR
jgi:predicted branched-subunit amino acid permease